MNEPKSQPLPSQDGAPMTHMYELITFLLGAGNISRAREMSYEQYLQERPGATIEPLPPPDPPDSKS